MAIGSDHLQWALWIMDEVLTRNSAEKVHRDDVENSPDETSTKPQHKKDQISTEPRKNRRSSFRRRWFMNDFLLFLGWERNFIWDSCELHNILWTTQIQFGRECNKEFPWSHKTVKSPLDHKVYDITRLVPTSMNAQNWLVSGVPYTMKTHKNRPIHN